MKVRIKGAPRGPTDGEMGSWEIEPSEWYEFLCPTGLWNDSLLYVNSKKYNRRAVRI
jgi:hypothetical protein